MWFNISRCSLVLFYLVKVILLVVEEKYLQNAGVHDKASITCRWMWTCFYGFLNASVIRFSLPWIFWIEAIQICHAWHCRPCDLASLEPPGYFNSFISFSLFEILYICFSYALPCNVAWSWVFLKLFHWQPVRCMKWLLILIHNLLCQLFRCIHMKMGNLSLCCCFDWLRLISFMTSPQCTLWQEYIRCY